MVRSCWYSLLTSLLLAAAPSCAGAQVLEPLKIAIVSRTVFYMPLWLAEERGYLRAEGFAPSVVVYDNAEKINEDLKAGRVQVAISTPESVILDAYNGGTLRIVAGNAEKLPHFIIAKPAIKSLSDLKDARIGVLSLQEGTTYLVRQVAKAAGLKENEYEIAPVGGAPTRWRLLKEGRIDAGLQPFPLSYEAEAAGFTNLGPVADYVADYQFTSVNVDERWARSRADTLVRFLRALRRGQDALSEDGDAASEIAAKHLNTTRDLARRALDDTARLKVLSKDLSLSTAGLRVVFESLAQSGALPKGAVFATTSIANETYLDRSRDIRLRDTGSFFIGGDTAQIQGQPVKEVRYAKDAPPLTVDPNGSYAYGQIYVQYAKLFSPRGSFPILFFNGGTSTAAMWDTTPDGRPGWQQLLLRRGYDTFVTDAVGKGRASWARFPEIFKAEPIFRPNEETWTLLRIGSKYTPEPSGRQAFENSQFPLEAFDEFAKQSVPAIRGPRRSRAFGLRQAHLAHLPVHRCGAKLRRILRDEVGRAAARALEGDRHGRAHGNARARRG